MLFRSPAALSAALKSLVADHAVRTRMASIARASVADYDERSVFARMVDVLTELASR